MLFLHEYSDGCFDDLFAGKALTMFLRAVKRGMREREERSATYQPKFDSYIVCA